MLVGGGSGGHITPLLAIAKHLKSTNPAIKIVAVTERGGKFAILFNSSENITNLRFISAGKFRRFHGESWLSRVFDIKRNILNMADGIRVILGIIQSFWMLVLHRPKIILLKGGFVGLPVGMCAWLLGIPYITHDSDALPGLSNRLISHGARQHAVGMSEDMYNYPAGKTVFVGVPVGEDFHMLNPAQIAQARKDIGIPASARVLMITGGSNGAQRLNEAILSPVINLLEQYRDLWLIHQFGEGNEYVYDNFPVVLRGRVIAEPFLSPLSDFSAAADVIITRAGATALAEFAAQAKACVVVPNPYLTGGHQLQNAIALVETGAIAVLQEQDMKDNSAVISLMTNLLEKPELCSRMGNNLHQAMPPNSAEKLANLLIQQITVRKQQ